jgi:predicted nucleic acid-binding protein
LLLERNEKEALFFISHMRQGNVIGLNDELSLYAAKLGKEYKLPMADSIIYATSIKYNSVLWTQDKHFQGCNR